MVVFLEGFPILFFFLIAALRREIFKVPLCGAV